MDALAALQTRVSSPLLEAPGPSQQQLDEMFKSALRAPDHGALRPWRFLVVEGDDRLKLAELFLQSALAKEPELPETKREKILKMPLRAPTIVVAICKTTEGHKVPVVEQQVAAGCATQNLLVAAYALGLGAMWRTGDMAYNSSVLSGLGLDDSEQIIGFVYLGTPSKERPLKPLDPANYVQSWPKE